MAITVPAYDVDSDERIASLVFAYASADNETLVALITANADGASSAAQCRVSSVIDDAHNVWQEGVSVFQAGVDGGVYTGVRVAIWYCIGVRATTSITVTMTQVVDSMACTVVRGTGITNTNGVIQTHSGASGTTGTTTPSTNGNVTASAGVNALICGVTAVADSDAVLTYTGSGWTVATNVDVAPSDPDDGLHHRSAYRIISATATHSTNWNIAPSASAAWCTISFMEGALNTSNPNPRWPQVTHEVGFGVDPNDPAAAATWVNITNRVTEFNTRRGRDYELARFEAGEAQIGLNNWDSAFDPLNASGTYYPDVRVMTPYRIRATWNGHEHRLLTGFVERWPQKWEDERGLSRLQVVDGLATLSGTRLQGTLGQEITADSPHAYWPLDDGSLSANAANKATITSTPLTKAQSVNGGGIGSFGNDMSLQSELSTCWRQTRSGADETYGTCLTTSMSLPQLSDGIVIECWAKYAVSALPEYVLIVLKGSAFSANALHRIVRMYVDPVLGRALLDVSDNTGALQTYTGASTGFNDNEWHHYVAHLTTTAANLWVDGELQVTGAPATVPGSSIDQIGVGGEVDAWTNDNIAAGDFSHVAVFEAATIDDRRVSVRANAGLSGFPERSGARVSRVLNYAGWRSGRAIDEGLTFLGAASTISKQTLLAVVQDIANWENGLVFVDGSGNLRFVDRGVRYNQALEYTFGEDEAGGEIPYETDVEIDFDPRYVYNDVTVTKAVNRLPDGTVITGGTSSHKKDDASVASYFTRTYDKTTGANSISQCEAEATWVLENYAQPRARLSRVSFVPSTNPDLWPAALTVEIGDRVDVLRRPFGGGDEITVECYVEQVAHQVQQNEWRVVLSLSPVLLTTYDASDTWILGSSVLAIDTIVGSP